jgi:predicted ferric reductase
MHLAGFISAVTLAITTALWIHGRIEQELLEDIWPWRAPAQITALWMLNLVALTLVAGCRARALESIFGGLDRAVRFHRQLGGAALVMLLVHIVLLMPPRIGPAIGEVVNPFHPNSPFALDVAVSWLLLPMALAIWRRRLPHHIWLWVHRVLAALLLAACAHSLTLAETVRAHEPLRFWMMLLIGIGAVALLYRLFLFRRLGPRHGYAVEGVEERPGGIVDLVLRPRDRRMSFDPGAFVYVSVKGSAEVPDELHPFSISSSPTERDMRLSIRKVGDWTRRLPALRPGTEIDVYGPFGGFTPHAFVGYRRLVLVGAGIGITPFLSILRFELVNNDFRRVWLYYSVRDRAEAPYDTELHDLAARADSWVDYHLWESKRQGRLTAADIHAEAGKLGDYAVMLCGTNAFLHDMRAQFRQLGLPDARIIAEEFQLR